jgi:hypothetical protein
VRHYLDHASTSPTRPEVVAAMLPWFGAADPGRNHAEGLAARVAVEEAREQVAASLGARSREVVFTSGATEAVVTATWMATERGEHVVLPAVEHRCVREASARSAVTVVGVDGVGRVDRPGALPAGQPRGRHPPARGRRRGPLPGAGRADPRRRRRCRRTRGRRLRGPGRRPAQRLGPQVRGAAGRGLPARAPGAPAAAPGGGRRPGAGPTGGHRERPRHRRLRGRGGGPGRPRTRAAWATA